MTESIALTADSTGRRLLEHMQWANAQMFEILQTLPDAALDWHAAHDDWSVRRIAHHLAGVSGRLLARAHEAAMPIDAALPQIARDFAELGATCAASDAGLVALADQPDRLVTFEIFGQKMTQPRSLILAQAVHHANEHRSQIAGILASNNLDAVNLDRLALWVFVGAID